MNRIHHAVNRMSGSRQAVSEYAKTQGVVIAMPRIEASLPPPFARKKGVPLFTRNDNRCLAALALMLTTGLAAPAWADGSDGKGGTPSGVSVDVRGGNGGAGSDGTVGNAGGAAGGVGGNGGSVSGGGGAGGADGAVIGGTGAIDTDNAITGGAGGSGDNGAVDGSDLVGGDGGGGGGAGLVHTGSGTLGIGHDITGGAGGAGGEAAPGIFGGGGGGGGSGLAHQASAGALAVTVDAGVAVTGGAGGAGGYNTTNGAPAGIAGGGAGGAGGAGISGGNLNIANAGIVAGGAGGLGGDEGGDDGAGGDGGAGGAGIAGDNLVIVNTGIINGGAGGDGGFGGFDSSDDGAGGLGGAGIAGSNLDITNSGTIQGGIAGFWGGTLLTLGHAIDFTGGSNTLRLLGGSLGGGMGINVAAGATLTLEPAAAGYSLGVTAIGGDGSVIKTGSGTLTLENAALHTGGTTISAGTLALVDDNATRHGMLFNSSVTVAAGATLDVAGTSGSSIGGTEIKGLAGAGTVTLGAAELTVNQSADTVFSGVISGAGGTLTKRGTGMLTLSGVNTYTGLTTIDAGMLRLGDGVSNGSVSGDIENNSGLIFNNVSALSYAGDISGSGALIKTGGSVLTLTGTHTYSGGTTINAGTLRLGNGVTDGSIGGDIENNAGLVFSNVGAFTYAGALSGTGLLIKTGAGTLTLTGDVGYTGSTTVNAGTLVFQSSGGFTSEGTLTNNATLVSFDALENTDTFENNGDFENHGTFVNTGAVENEGTFHNDAGATLANNGIFENYSAFVSDGNVVNADTFNNNGVFTSTGTLDTTSGAFVNHASGLLTIGDGGILLGDVENNGQIVFDRAGALTYAGRISGTGDLIKDGAGTLTLTGSNDYSGSTVIEAGTLRLGDGSTDGSVAGGIDIGNGATLVLDSSGDTLYAGVITGGGGFTKSGAGTAVLTGDSGAYAGAATVAAGALVVDGALGSVVTVDDGASLSGRGSVGGLGIANGGVLAPGNSIGVLAVGSDLTFDAGAIYRVETDAAGNADRVDVGGNIVIDGGTVEVQAANGNYARDTNYTILTAGGEVTGAFDGVASNLAFLTPALTYGATEVALTLTRNDAQFSDAATTPNQIAFAQYLDQVADEPALGGLVAQFEALSAEQAQAAFANAGGAALAAGANVAFAGSEQFMQVLSSRLDVPAGTGGTGLAWSGIMLAAADAPMSFGTLAPGQGRGFWMLGTGAFGNVDGNDNANGFDWRAGGIAAGMDVDVTGTVLGAAFGYDRSRVDFDGDAGSTRIRSPRLALYARHDAGRWQVRGTAGYADIDIETQRAVVIGGDRSIAGADHAADEWSAYGEVNYRIALGARQDIKPMVGARYVQLKESGYVETGSAASLAVDGRDAESTAALSGMRYARRFNADRGNFELRAIWSREFGDMDPALQGRFAAAPAGAGFTVTGVPRERNALTLGAGIANRTVNDVVYYLDTNAELRDGQAQYLLTAGVRYRW